MKEVLEGLYAGIMNTSITEWSAVIMGVLYVVFAAKRMIICWVFGGISAALYVYLCFTVQLYIESTLQLFYLVMAFIGWRSWNESNNQENDIRIQTWSINKHIVNVVVSGTVALLLGFSFDLWTNQENPYLDAFTTCYSLSATYMVTRKILENWIYWIIIDAVSIVLYASRGFHLSSVLFFLYTILAIIGFIMWYKQLKLQRGV